MMWEKNMGEEYGFAEVGERLGESNKLINSIGTFGMRGRQ